MKRHIQPGFAALPAAALAAALAGAEGVALALAASFALAQLCALGAANALRRASGKLVSRQRLEGAAACALGMAALGAIAGQALARPLAGWLADARALLEGSGSAAPILAEALDNCLGAAGGLDRLHAWLGAGAAVVAGQCAFAALDAMGKPAAARLLDAMLCAALAAAWGFGAEPPLALVGALGAVLAIVAVRLTFRTLVKNREASLSAAPLREIPLALAQGLLFPALAAAWIAAAPQGLNRASLAALLAGWTALELLRPPFRRDVEESLPLRLLATIFTLLVAISALFWQIFLPDSADAALPAAQAVALGAGCLLALGADAHPRTAAAALLLTAASFGAAALQWRSPAPEFAAPAALAAAALLALALSAHGALRRLHVLRAQRRMARARRATGSPR